MELSAKLVSKHLEFHEKRNISQSKWQVWPNSSLTQVKRHGRSNIFIVTLAQKSF